MLLSGSALRQIFAWQNPFREDGAGTGLSEPRLTILAANANFPVEIPVKAFCLAAADWPGSPVIVQFSHNSLKVLGGQDPVPAASGGRFARQVLDHYVRESGARYAAAALDHFRVPPYPGDAGEGSSRAVRVARGAVDDALEALRAVASPVSDEDLQSYVAYLSSPTCADFKREFAAVLTSFEPAWAMIDTEKLPPILDCALTRDLVDFIRRGLGFTEMMLEAEYGVTGRAGESQDYQTLRGTELGRFAEEVATFVAYTGADGIAYPIGMEHGAPTAERHEPDEARLEAVQRRITQVTGRYVPFAQHGGTGAARLVRGLVGKNNVNTHFLVAAANRIADLVMADSDRIRAGVKEACGAAIYERAVQAVKEATVEKLKEAATFGVAAEVEDFLGPK